MISAGGGASVPSILIWRVRRRRWVIASRLGTFLYPRTGFELAGTTGAGAGAGASAASSPLEMFNRSRCAAVSPFPGVATAGVSSVSPVEAAADPLGDMDRAGDPSLVDGGWTAVDSGTLVSVLTEAVEERARREAARRGRLDTEEVVVDVALAEMRAASWSKEGSRVLVGREVGTSWAGVTVGGDGEDI